MSTKTVSAATIARTVCLMLALVNQTLSIMGKPVIPIEDKTIESVITLLFTIVTSLVAWWKNNSFTQEALEADEVLATLKGRME